MKKFFYTLLLSAVFFNIQLHAVNGYYSYVLRHHNGLLEQGTNTAKPIFPESRVPYYYSNNDYLYRSPMHTFCGLKYPMIIAFTLIKNDGRYCSYISVQ